MTWVSNLVRSIEAAAFFGAMYKTAVGRFLFPGTHYGGFGNFSETRKVISDAGRKYRRFPIHRPG